jgi:hypothetical protein
VVYASARLSKMATYRFWITTSPRSATSMLPQHTSEGEVGRLAIVAYCSGHKTWGMDNIIAALEHNDRIRRLELLDMTSSQLEKVLATMRQPFPALTRLWLGPTVDETAPVVPASFLGGSVSPLQSLWLDCISFPGLPNLLSFSTHLVELFLF